MDLKVPPTNFVGIAGQVVSPPHFYERNGKDVCEFVIANNRSYKTRGGEYREKSCFIPIITWGRLAKDCHDCLETNSPVYVEGHLETPIVGPEERRGKPRIKASEVQFLEKGAARKGHNGKEETR